MRILPLLLLGLWLGAGSVRAGEDPTRAPDAGILGTWYILTEFGGQERTSHFVLERGAGGALQGTYHDSSGSSAALQTPTFEVGTLKFQRSARGRQIAFEAQIEGGRLKGHHLIGSRRIPTRGRRGKQAFEAFLARRRKERERSNDLQADYEKYTRRVLPRDSFPVLFDPPLVAADKARDVREDEPVIGVVVGEQAKAYPISIMGVHELVNDTCGGRPIAASW